MAPTVKVEVVEVQVIVILILVVGGSGVPLGGYTQVMVETEKRVIMEIVPG